MEDTKQQLLNATYKQLYHHGYQGTSLSKIMAESNLTKGALYHHFKSKKEIALETISTMVGGFVSNYWELPAQNTKTPYQTLLERIHDLAIIKINDEQLIDTKYGCFLNNLIQEMSPLDEDFSKLLRELYERFENAVFTLLKKAQEQGEIQKEIDVYELSLFVTTTIEASISLAKLKNDIKYYYISTKHIEQYLSLLNGK